MADEVVRIPLAGWQHQELLYETIDDGRIAIITMNRPERMNSSDPGMAQRWVDAWTTFADDEQCRVAIVTGAGDRAFSAGQDLKIRAELEAEGGDAPYRNPTRTVTPIGEKLGCWKPTIAAINGYAIAGGWSTAQYCTFRIAADHAEMNIAEARWNQAASFVSTLTRLVGAGIALEFCLMGDRRFSAQRAYEVGLVNKVVPREELMDEAIDWARTLVRMAPRTVENFNQMIHQAASMSQPEATAFANALEVNLRGMEDSLEGPTAFAEKRDAVFKNR
ncbi:MAG: enoyl-CoA hydratase/isomerase family protein [Dehalococcoidia bacterium]|jgi:enoyl-CoA hydratase/carnithine racemase|nr:enoyl-CoA hydratase/isomerase family protein [Dehalococcoidia bacterium]